MSTPRRMMFINDWKMYKGFKEGIDFIKEAGEKVPEHIESVIFPQYPLLPEAVRNQGKNLKIGVQNVHSAESGSYTGEVSCNLVAEIGAKYCFVGHAERWKMYNETHEECNKKVLQILKCGLVPILHIGEEADLNDDAQSEAAIRNELNKELANVSKEDAYKVVLSFAPMTSSGTGNAVTPEIAVKYVKLMREIIKEKFGEDVAKKMRVLYSGSLNKDNLKGFIEQPEIDGCTCCRSALEIKNFLAMAQITEEVYLAKLSK